MDNLQSDFVVILGEVIEYHFLQQGDLVTVYLDRARHLTEYTRGSDRKSMFEELAPLLHQALRQKFPQPIVFTVNEDYTTDQIPTP